MMGCSVRWNAVHVELLLLVFCIATAVVCVLMLMTAAGGTILGCRAQHFQATKQAAPWVLVLKLFFCAPATCRGRRPVPVAVTAVSGLFSKLDQTG
jgi:hypothetical protein